ncbi:trimeric intracellular cation channel family protein [Mariprofundus sp. EBB-1]|uniref:trimeric intracellular cation channel family protein n=1 Tax=Mariprofundus sp. EBB-1 TaxID=2650971 RepID=UPI000EF222E1|nr:trimeric intracellular cation channel family protein [Mariprofundus sp. EBB-1]RLL53677.1 trimeric intracellular cation channel family protein [Mariprofundus sp. EBB-1]
MLTANMQLPMSIHLLDLFGTAVFALTGALRALTKKLDLMGAVVLAIVTALGGGMMRDALLGRHPPAAFVDEVYLLIAIFTGIAAFFWGRQIREQESWLIIFDAIGLGVFTLVGAWIADQAGLGVTGIIFIAMLTATGGGVLRAMLVAEIPFMLKKEIYASASLIGAASFLLFDYLNFSIGLIIWAVVLITIGIRLISWRYNYNLPK